MTQYNYKNKGSQTNYTLLFSFDTQSLLSYTFPTQKIGSIHSVAYVLSLYEMETREKRCLFQTGEPAVLIELWNFFFLDRIDRMFRI